MTTRVTGAAETSGVPKLLLGDMMPTHELQKLNNRHYQILDLCIRGFGIKDIAAQLDMTEAGVGIVVRSPNFKHELAIRRGRLQDMHDERAVNEVDEAKKVLQNSARTAAIRLRQSLASGNDSAANSAADSILDRVGLSRISKQESKNVSIGFTLSEETAKLILETIRMEEDD